MLFVPIFTCSLPIVNKAKKRHLDSEGTKAKWQKRPIQRKHSIPAFDEHPPPPAFDDDFEETFVWPHK